MKIALSERFSARLRPSALAAIGTAATVSADGRETGGILLGRDSGDDGVIEVVRAAGPGPVAIRRHSYFLRDLAYTKRLARLAFEREGLQWVGDWHTHPRGPDRPSDFDLATYARHLADPELGFDAFVAMIVTPYPQHEWGGCRLSTFVYTASV